MDNNNQINNPNGVELAVRQATKVLTTIEVKSWFAGQLRQKLDASHAFRRIDVTAVLRETPRAVQIEGYFNTNVASNCYCCGRVLTTEISKASGIGPVCAQKAGVPRVSLGDAPAVLEFMNALAKRMGQFETWIPKSQISYGSVSGLAAPKPAPAKQKIEENQIQVADWLAEKNGHPTVLTVISVKVQTAKWFLLKTNHGEIGVPKSQIVQGRVA
jgi:hypothetical protein